MTLDCVIVIVTGKIKLNNWELGTVKKYGC